MANGSSSASPSTDTFLIFVDTSLDTHFVIGVSSEDTVADLNGKLRACHSVCFPYIGDITIQSLKVRRRGCFYHLTDMHVKSVFDGIRGSWVLYVDAISACYQAGTTGNAVICDGEQQQKDRLLDPEPNSSTLCLGADAVQDFGMNGSLTGKDLIPLDTDVENEMQTFPNARPEMLSLHNDISVLHVGTNNVDLAPNGANGNSSGDVLKLHEPVEGDMPGHHGTNKVVDEGEEDASEADRGNIGDEATVGLVHGTKEKSKKRSSSFRNDPLLEKGDSYMEKKKHKKKKDGSSEVHTGDPLVELGRCKPGKMSSLARDDFSLKDQTSGKERRKKREKKEERGSELADGTVQVNKEVPREAFTDVQTNVDKQANRTFSFSKTTIPDGSTGEVGTALPLSTNLKGSECGDKTLGYSSNFSEVPIVDVSFQEAATLHESSAQVLSEIPNKSRRNKKKSRDELSKNINDENREGGSVAPSDADDRNSHGTRRKKSDKMESSSLQPDTYDTICSTGDQVTGGCLHGKSKLGEFRVLEKSMVEDTTVLSGSVGRSGNRRKREKTKAEARNVDYVNVDYVIKDVLFSLEKENTEENPKKLLEYNHEPDKTSLHGEAAPPETLPDNSMGKEVEENTGVLLGEDHENFGLEIVQNVTQDKHARPIDPNDHIELLKTNIKSVIPEAVQLVPPTSMVEDTAVLFRSDGRSGRRRKRKRNKTKAEARNVDYVTEENPKKLLEDNHEQDKTSVLGEVAPPESLPDNSMGKAVEENTGVLLGEDHENFGSEILHNVTQDYHAEPTGPNDHIELPNINIESVIPEAGQLEPPTSMGTESGVGSAVFGKTNDGTDGITPTQPPSEVKKGSPFSMILRSKSRYKKAKATASQSQAQLEGGESQPVDVSP